MDRRKFFEKAGLGAIAAGTAAAHLDELEKLLPKGVKASVFTEHQGMSIDIGSIAGIGHLTPKEVLDMYYETGILIWQSSDGYREFTAPAVIPRMKKKDG